MKNIKFKILALVILGIGWYISDIFIKDNSELMVNEQESNSDYLKETGFTGFMGTRKYNDAKYKCLGMGLRLPTSEELKSAENSGLTKDWLKDTDEYWIESDAGFLKFNYYNLEKKSDDFTMNNRSRKGYRCHRN